MSSITLQRDGYAQVPQVLSLAQCITVGERLAALGTPGTRSPLAQPWCQELRAQLREHVSLASCIPPNFVAVQCTFFEKSLGTNWLVSVHQDLSIPVRARVVHPGLAAWSKKEGVWHVRPPVEVLSALVAVRLHLDACGVDDGALRVVVGSHAKGVLAPAEAVRIRDESAETLCLADAGDVLIMKPLCRRVLHWLLGPRDLPWGLQWATVA